MSATLFLVFCILGCDFLLYVLFQWTYGEKRRGLSRRSIALKNTMNQPRSRPFLVAPRLGDGGGEGRPRSGNLQTEHGERGQFRQFNDARPYRRIAESFAQIKR